MTPREPPRKKLKMTAKPSANANKVPGDVFRFDWMNAMMLNSGVSCQMELSGSINDWTLPMGS